MNTRSSSVARKDSMTVDFSSRSAENTSSRAVCQSNVEENTIVTEEESSLGKDLRRTSEDLCNDCEEDRNIIKRSRGQSFAEKEDLSYNGGVAKRNSSRPGKRPRTVSPQRSLSTTPESSKFVAKQLETSCKRQKRQWESWAPTEKDCFFEALLEHSKDFDKIHNYLVTVHKRRGDLTAFARNKDQVRHFYYRTLNKIQKYMPEPPDTSDSKKTNYEVRSLICYGELRKKFRSLKEKDGKKLTELISTGKTTVRYQGRNFSIRAPVCRALKKLNANVAGEEADHIPNKVMIELIPGDNKAWSSIQTVAQNPRLRASISSRKSLSSLLIFLLSKWKLGDSTNLTLSPTIVESHPKPAVSKVSDSETVATCKPPDEEINDCEEERARNLSQTVRERCDAVCTVGTETVDVASSDGSGELKVETQEIETCDTGKEQEPENDDAPSLLHKDTWNMSNCGGMTIADVYRKLGCPRKMTLSYSLCTEDPVEQPLTSHALEQLVKLATGEFQCRTDTRNENKKGTVSKDSATPSKPNKVLKTQCKCTTKQPKLAPKIPQETLVYPPVVHSVINQVSASSSTRSGNHLTFGFTPITSLQHPSPFLARTKRNRRSRVVVQRALLPRPLRLDTDAASPSEPSQGHVPPRKGVGSICQDLRREGRGESPSPSIHDGGFSVDSLIDLALEQDLPDKAENVLSSSSKSAGHLAATWGVGKNASSAAETSDGNVCTEEIDCGVSGGGRTVKQASCLVEAIENLDSSRDTPSVEHGQDLLDNLKSSEDEDPFKLLSPPHVQQFQSESWLNEESSDFSFGNLFGNTESSPTKQKKATVLDTPKKSQSDLRVAESEVSENVSKYSQLEPVFCGMIDESSVDYVRKFRDLAKKMTNDSETSSFDNVESSPSTNTSSTVSFRALLSDATSK